PISDWINGAVGGRSASRIVELTGIPNKASHLVGPVHAGRMDKKRTLAWAERADVVGGRIYRTVGRCSESVNSGDNHLAQVVYAGRSAKAEVVYGVLRLGENDERHEETCRNC